VFGDSLENIVQPDSLDGPSNDVSESP
jgi:hypothetical protein